MYVKLCVYAIPTPCLNAFLHFHPYIFSGKMHPLLGKVPPGLAESWESLGFHVLFCWYIVYYVLCSIYIVQSLACIVLPFIVLHVLLC